MSERVKFLGQLAEAEAEERRLKLKAEGLVRSMRDLLDPIKDPDLLREDLVLEQSVDLANSVALLREKQQTVNRIKDELGR